jgi:hypothetical protein
MKFIAMHGESEASRIIQPKPERSSSPPVGSEMNSVAHLGHAAGGAQKETT